MNALKLIIFFYQSLINSYTEKFILKLNKMNVNITPVIYFWWWFSWYHGSYLYISSIVHAVCVGRTIYLLWIISRIAWPSIWKRDGFSLEATIESLSNIICGKVKLKKNKEGSG